MLAGIWILLFLPLLNALNTFMPSCAPIPNIFGIPGGFTLDDSFLTSSYEPLLFCMGIVLFFSKERNRRAGRFDWTRRWGVLCSYVVLLLSVVQVLFIVALVAASIASVFLSLPLRHQPKVTLLLVNCSWGYLHYGPHARDMLPVALVAFSSIAVLLACVPLFDALRSSGPKRVALFLLAPLALFSVVHIAQIGRNYYYNGMTGAYWAEIFQHQVYFSPWLLIGYIANRGKTFPAWSPITLGGSIVEAIKWCVILTIAVWLSIAQVSARRSLGRRDAPPFRA